MRRSKTYLALLGGFAAVAVAIFLRCGGWMAIDPNYRTDRLRGLTSAQVKARLGPPDYDSWVPGNTSGPTNEVTMGPHVIAYYLGTETRKITFSNDRVVRVEQFGK